MTELQKRVVDKLTEFVGLSPDQPQRRVSVTRRECMELLGLIDRLRVKAEGGRPPTRLGGVRLADHPLEADSIIYPPTDEVWNAHMPDAKAAGVDGRPLKPGLAICPKCRGYWWKINPADPLDYAKDPCRVCGQSGVVRLAELPAGAVVSMQPAGWMPPNPLIVPDGGLEIKDGDTFELFDGTYPPANPEKRAGAKEPPPAGSGGAP